MPLTLTTTGTTLRLLRLLLLLLRDATAAGDAAASGTMGGSNHQQQQQQRERERDAADAGESASLLASASASASAATATATAGQTTQRRLGMRAVVGLVAVVLGLVVVRAALGEVAGWLRRPGSEREEERRRKDVDDARRESVVVVDEDGGVVDLSTPSPSSSASLVVPPKRVNNDDDDTNRIKDDYAHESPTSAHEPTDKEEDADAEPKEEEEEPEPDLTDAETYDSPAPRTHAGPYNEYDPNRRYVIYSPSGGFNNQREELEAAMYIGSLLNRTVYVPMAGRHEQLWKSYDRLRGNSLFPMDRILDFRTMETYPGVRLTPLNISVSVFVNRFIAQHGAGKVRIVEEFERWHKDEVVSKLSGDKHAIVHFHGTGMYHRWFLTATMVKVKQHVRYAPYLRQLAVRITREYFGGPFYAMHIRRGDYSNRQFSSSVSFVRLARGRGWKTGKFPVYVATEPRRDEAYFEPLVSAFNVTFSADLPRDRLRDYTHVFPPGKLREDMLGLFEQLVCALALDFIGTPFSTFSSWIEFMRNTASFTFPEAVGAVGNG